MLGIITINKEDNQMEYVKPQYDEPKRGEIYYIMTDNDTESVRSEQCNHDRPAIIVSNDVGNKFSPIVEVVYLTTRPKKDLPTHVDIYTTVKPSTALCEQIYTVSKMRLRKYINECTGQEMDDINKALSVSLGISTTKGTARYMEKWLKLEQGQQDTVESELTETKEEEQQAQEPITQASSDLQIELDKAKLELEMYKKFYDDTYALLDHAVSK